MEIVRYIKELLIERGKVAIPNLGTFEKVMIPASIDKQKGDMQPPKPNVVFYDKVPEGNTIFCEYVSKQLKITQSEASQKVKEQIDVWKSDLNAGKKVIVEGLGHLQKDKDSKIVFHTKIDAKSFPEFYGLSSINVKTKDKLVEEKKVVKKAAVPAAKTVTKNTKSPKKPKPPVKKKETVVKTDKEKKKDKRRLIFALLLIPFLVLIFLAIWKFDYVKQQSSAVVSYFKGDTSKQSSEINNVAEVNPENTQQISSNDAKTQVDSSTQKENAKTEALLKKYTIIDSKTNNQVSPKVEEFQSANKIHIIAGSFSNKRNAKKERRKLLRKGFKNAQVLPLNNNLYRVSIEAFDKVDDAVKDISRIKAKDSSLDVWLLIDK